MTDVELAEGVLLPGFTGTAVPGWLAAALDRGLAGVCLFAPNVGDDLRALTAELAARGALVAADEEGGAVTRIEHARGSSWPGNAALGRLDDVDVTAVVAAAMGEQCRAAGVHLALGPVADVQAEPDNPVIGLRAFGSDPELVARHTAAFVRGLQGTGVAAAAKHFPGHGDTTVDSHLDLPVVAGDEATLRARDLPPFAAAVAAGVRAVLTAHVVYPALDAEPATMSAPVLALLRDELGFDGVVVSDALDMRAVADRYGRGPAAVRALAAGVDLLCTGNPAFPAPYDDERGYREVRDAVLDALADGTLCRDRVAEAADRVAALTTWCRESRRSDPRVAPIRPASRADPTRESLGLDVVRRVAEVSGEVRRRGVAHVLDLGGAALVAAGESRSRVLDALRRREPAVTAAAVRDVAAVPAALAGAADRPVVALVDAPGRDPAQAAALAAVRAARPDAVAVHVGLPDARAVPPAPSITLWGGARAHAEVAAELLTGVRG